MDLFLMWVTLMVAVYSVVWLLLGMNNRLQQYRQWRDAERYGSDLFLELQEIDYFEAQGYFAHWDINSGQRWYEKEDTSGTYRRVPIGEVGQVYLQFLKTVQHNF